jgi:ankyrin repeat protein
MQMWTGLHWACQDGNVECLRVLIKNKADVDCKAENGWAGLYFACQNGNPECLRLLIENNADVDYKNEGGVTGLHAACQNREVECIRLLVENNADVAARKGHLECVKVMMKLRLTSITRIRSKRALCCTL